MTEKQRAARRRLRQITDAATARARTQTAIDAVNAERAPRGLTQEASLTMIEFSPADHINAENAARALGYTQTAYTSTSALIGLFCLPENPAYHPHAPHVGGCLIKTRELGLMFVQDADDDARLKGRRA